MNPIALLRRIRRRLRRRRWQDVVIVSFPKAGRTWLRVMLNEMDVQVAHTHAGARRDRIPDRREFANKRVILLIRDPRDTVVSGFYQETKRVENKYGGTLSDFIRDPRRGIERIVEFNLAWLADHTVPTQFHLIEYELLRTNTKIELQMLLDFIQDRRASDDRIGRAVERTDFARMQKLEKDGSLRTRYGKSLTPGDASDPDSLKVRKGKIGGYQDEMSDADIAYCAAVMEKHCYTEKVAAYRQTLAGCQ